MQKCKICHLNETDSTSGECDECATNWHYEEQPNHQ